VADFMVPFNLPGDAEESVKVLGTKMAVFGDFVPCVQDYMVRRPGRQTSSYSPP
jgi:hypothetical protein